MVVQDKEKSLFDKMTQNEHNPIIQITTRYSSTNEHKRRNKDERIHPAIVQNSHRSIESNSIHWEHNQEYDQIRSIHFLYFLSTDLSLYPQSMFRIYLCLAVSGVWWFYFGFIFVLFCVSNEVHEINGARCAEVDSSHSKSKLFVNGFVFYMYLLYL